MSNIPKYNRIQAGYSKIIVKITILISSNSFINKIVSVYKNFRMIKFKS